MVYEYEMLSHTCLESSQNYIYNRRFVRSRLTDGRGVPQSHDYVIHNIVIMSYSARMRCYLIPDKTVYVYKTILQDDSCDRGSQTHDRTHFPHYVICNTARMRCYLIPCTRRFVRSRLTDGLGVPQSHAHLITTRVWDAISYPTKLYVPSTSAAALASAVDRRSGLLFARNRTSANAGCWLLGPL